MPTSIPWRTHKGLIYFPSGTHFLSDFQTLHDGCALNNLRGVFQELRSLGIAKMWNIDEVWRELNLRLKTDNRRVRKAFRDADSGRNGYVQCGCVE